MLLKITKFVLLILVFVFVFGMFSGRVWDPDFWWHLKTGEYIYQTGSLPDSDPFAYTSLSKDPLNPESKRIRFILTSYWLAQLILFGVYKIAGFQGIILLRAFILAAIVFFVYRALRREGGGFYTAIVLVIPVAIVLSNFTGERPQLFSFLLSFLLIYLLEGYRMSGVSHSAFRTPNSERRTPNFYYLLPVPFIMLIWANLHGGVFLGIAVIAIYIICEIAKFYSKRLGTPLPAGQLKLLVIIGVLSILVFMLNPNGLNVFSVLAEFQNSRYMESIVESKSPFSFLSTGFYNQELITYIVLAIICVLLFIINFRRIDITDIALISFFLYLSATAARTIPFFVPVSALMTMRYGVKTYKALSEKTELHLKFPNIFLRIKSGSLQTVLAAVLSVSMFIALANIRIINKGVVWERYPRDAAEFLKNNKIQGNMLNPYVWGGYLIWALYPDYKVFVDGRGLIEEVFFQNSKIFGANPQQFGEIPEWKAFMNAYNISFIITSSVDDFSGKTGPLIPILIDDPEWKFVYMDNNSLIFVKDGPENAEIIQKYSMPKQWVWNEVITEAAYKAKKVPVKTNFYITMGDAFAAKQSYADARTMYLKAKEAEPSNPVVQQRLDSISN